MAAVLGAMSVVLNQVFIWPQVWRARRQVQGIAVGTAVTGLLARSAWLAYGLTVRDLVLIIGNITVAVGFALLLVLIVRAGAARAGTVVVAAVVMAGLAALAAASRPALAVIAVVSSATVNFPQMARAIADRHRLAGVSATTYWLIAAASACWLLYGIAAHDLAISAPCVLLLPSAILTAALATAADRRRARGPHYGPGRRSCQAPRIRDVRPDRMITVELPDGEIVSTGTDSYSHQSRQPRRALRCN
jgi:uncharacterized protein with PQ loop repeat